MSRSAARLLEELSTRGVDVRAAGDTLQLRPPGVCADLLDDLREHKVELLEILLPSLADRVRSPSTFYPGQPHLEKLAHCIGGRVSTPHGDGVLLAVRKYGPCYVQLDASPDPLVFISWQNISPRAAP